MVNPINKLTTVGYVAETVAGTTPATPAFKRFWPVSETFEAQRDYKIAAELDGLRGQRNSAVAAAGGAGGAKFMLRYGEFDDIIAAALRGAWTTNVLVSANTPAPMTFETKYEGGGTDLFKRLTGAEVDTFSLEMKAGEEVSGEFTVMSRSADFVTTPIAGATYTVPTNNRNILGVDFASAALAGIAAAPIISLSMSVSNNMSMSRALGSLNPVDIAPGQLTVTGSLSIYADPARIDFLRAYLDGGSTGLSFQIGTAALSRYSVELPNLTFTGMKTEAASVDGNVLSSIEFRALQASSLSGEPIRITRGV